MNEVIGVVKPFNDAMRAMEEDVKETGEPVDKIILGKHGSGEILVGNKMTAVRFHRTGVESKPEGRSPANLRIVTP